MKNENWDAAYAEQKGSLPVLPTVDEAVRWANDLISKIQVKHCSDAPGEEEG